MESLIEELVSITEDQTIPRNVRQKIQEAILSLQNEEVEECLRANKALQELEDLSENPNIPSYVRPQLWNIVSQLETI